METLGTKVVVLGAGGAGCKLLNQLAPANPTNAELIAVDTDKAQLQSLDPKIKSISIGDAIASCRSPDEMKAALGSEMQEIENAVSGASMAVVFASLGGKTGSCLSSVIADLCSNKGTFTLVIAAYPFMSMGGSEGAERVAKNLREHSSGVVIIDNNLNLESSDVSVVGVFEKINAIVLELVVLLINSISGIGYMTLTADELMHFFHGDVYFTLTAGRGKSLEEASARAVEDVHRYMGHSGVKRMLLAVAGPAEAGLDEMRVLNDSIQGKYDPEAIKWLGAYSASGYTDLLVVSAIEEMPLLQGVEQPAPAVSLGIVPEVTAPMPAEAIEESEVAPTSNAVPAKSGVPVTKSVAPTAKPVEKKVQAGYFDFSSLGPYKEPFPQKKFKSPALVGLDKKPETVQKRPQEKRESIDIYALAKTEKKDIDIYSLAKTGYQVKYAPIGREEADRREQISKKERYAQEAEERSGYKSEVDEMVDDLTGFPTIEEPRTYSKGSKESQKRIKDYGNLDDIGFV